MISPPDKIVIPKNILRNFSFPFTGELFYAYFRMQVELITRIKLYFFYEDNSNITRARFTTLNAICRELECQPGDILEYVDD